jgi:hypothetical protein
MAGPLLPLVAAGIGAKLLLWNKRGAILKHMLRKQAISIIGNLETVRLRLYRSHRKDIATEAAADVYRITCNGEDKFAPRFGIDMHLFAVAPEEGAAYLVAIPATLASEHSFVALYPVDILDAGFAGLMTAVRKEIDKMEGEGQDAKATAPQETAKTSDDAPASKTEDPVQPPKKPKADKNAKVEAAVGGDIPTDGQAEVLKAAIAHPGTVLTGVSPQSIGACKRRGWIAPVGKKLGSLKDTKWQATEAGSSALAAYKA